MSINCALEAACEAIRQHSKSERHKQMTNREILNSSEPITLPNGAVQTLSEVARDLANAIRKGT